MIEFKNVNKEYLNGTQALHCNLMIGMMDIYGGKIFITSLLH